MNFKMNEEVNFNQVPKRGNIGLIIGVIII